MSYKKNLLFLGLLAMSFNLFSIKKQISPAPRPKKTNTVIEATKGITALLGAAFFAHVIVQQETITSSLISTITDGEQRRVPFKAIPANLITAIACQLIFPPETNESIERYVYRLIKNASMISAVCCYILGNYGAMKLYNLVKNKNN